MGNQNVVGVLTANKNVGWLKRLLTMLAPIAHMGNQERTIRVITYQIVVVLSTRMKTL